MKVRQEISENLLIENDFLLGHFLKLQKLDDKTTEEGIFTHYRHIAEGGSFIKNKYTSVQVIKKGKLLYKVIKKTLLHKQHRPERR